MLAPLLILALSATALAMPRLDMTVVSGVQETIPYDKCPEDQRHFLLPHEYDCTKFYYCEYGQRWLTPRDCALGTHFSFELQVCVHPIQAGCTLPGVPTEAPEVTETEAPETEATTSSGSSNPAGIVTSPHTTEAPSSTEAAIISTTAAPSSTEASIISSPHTTEAPETETTSGGITGGIVSSPHTTEAPSSTEAAIISTTAAPSSTEASIISSPHTTEAPETETTSGGITGGIVSSPHTTEAPSSTEAAIISTTAAPSSTEASIISSPHTTEAPETETTSGGITGGIVSSPHTTEGPSSTEAAIISTTAAPNTEAPTTASPIETAPESTEWLDNGCPADWHIHWLLPHEECNKFYYCNFGQKVERVCPATTVFDPKLQVCVWTADSNCASGNGEDGNEGGEDNSGEDNNGEDNNNTENESNEVEWLENGCPADWNVHWLLPHESECNKFYYCVHGNKIERECSDPLHFNPTLQVCDWAENAGCASSGSNSAEDNSPATEDNSSSNEVEDGNNGGSTEEGNGEWLDNGCPADSNTHWLLPHESDCGKFYYCVNGEKVERECSAPLHFNPTIQVCDWPESAGCTSGGNNSEESDNDNGESAEDNNTDTDGDDNGNGSGGQDSAEDNNTDTDGGDNGNGSGGQDSAEDNNTDTDGGDNGNGSGEQDSAEDNSLTTEEDSSSNEVEDGNNGGSTEEGNGEWLENGCPADSNTHWLIPHESNCAKFYYCVNGQKVERECSAPLHFNPTIQVCDWPENAGCASGGNSDESAEDNSPATEDNSSSNEVEDGNNGGSTEEGNGEWLDNGCPADSNTHWLLPHESDCGKFYYCVNGEKVERECSAPLHFNPTIQVCDWAENAGCASGDNNTGDDSEEDNNPATEDNGSSNEEDSNGGSTEESEWLDNGCPSDPNTHWLLPHESDCGIFYYCVNGNKVERECPDPLHFNPTLQVCDWAENAGCASSGNNGGEDGGNGGEDGGNGGEDGGNGGEDGGNGGEDGGNGGEDGGNGGEDGGNGGEDGGNGGEDGGNGGEDGGNGGEDGGNGGEDGGNGGEDGGNGGEDGSGEDVIVPPEEPDHSQCASSCNVRPWAHKTACDKYWRCEGEEATLVVCSEGLHFNANSGTCDFICNANCVRENVQTTADQQGLKIFVPWDKVKQGVRYY